MITIILIITPVSSPSTKPNILHVILISNDSFYQQFYCSLNVHKMVIVFLPYWIHETKQTNEWLVGVCKIIVQNLLVQIQTLDNKPNVHCWSFCFCFFIIASSLITTHRPIPSWEDVWVQIIETQCDSS